MRNKRAKSKRKLGQLIHAYHSSKLDHNDMILKLTTMALLNVVKEIKEDFILIGVYNSVPDTLINDINTEAAFRIILEED